MQEEGFVGGKDVPLEASWINGKPMSAVSIHMVIKFPEDGHTRETHAVDRSPLPVGTRLVKKERKKKSFRNRKKKKKGREKAVPEWNGKVGIDGGR